MIAVGATVETPLGTFTGACDGGGIDGAGDPGQRSAMVARAARKTAYEDLPFAGEEREGTGQLDLPAR